MGSISSDLRSILGEGEKCCQGSWGEGKCLLSRILRFTRKQSNEYNLSPVQV